jgi:dihydroorotase
MHCHLRSINEEIFYKVLPWTARYYGRAVVQPNLNDDLVSTADQAAIYEKAIRAETARLKLPDFRPLMTIKVTPKTSIETVIEAKTAGVLAAKFYPLGVTTNSAGGIEDFVQVGDIYACLEEIGMPALFHCEKPGARKSTAELEFIPVLQWIFGNFPKMKAVVEHVSSEAMLDYVLTETPNNVGLTLTAHHLLLTDDDVLGNPWNYCKPTAKTALDRKALVKAAVSGNPKIWFGSDSAPHLKEKKTTLTPAAGIPNPGFIALPTLAEIFEQADRLDYMNDYVSRRGAEFYDLSLNQGEIELVAEEWQVPDEIDGIVPFRAGQTLRWKIAEI